MTKLFIFSSAETAINILLIVSIVLIVFLAAAIVLGVVFYKKLNKKATYNTRKNVEGGRIGATAFERLEDTEERIFDLTDNVDDLYRRMQKTYQRVGVVKYNAYSGGNMSFVLAMLDECNSGFILNVINGREGSNMYLKEVIGGTCTERLGAEEAHALDIAISSGEI